MSSKISVKQALLNQKFASSLEEADKLVLSKRVFLDGQIIRYGGDKIRADQALTVAAERKYFSRAGEKLEFALNKFQITVKEKICADLLV